MSAAHWLPLVLAAVTLAVYVATAPPGIVAGDSPELVTTISTLGVCHPPGYPLYHLTGRFLALVLWFLPVARVCNLFSSIAAVGTLFVAYLLLSGAGVRRWVALAGLGALAFSQIFWHFAIVTEVYMLNLLFVALATWLVATWNRNGGWRRLYLLALVMGFGLTHHTTIGIYYPLYLGLVAMGLRPGAKPSVGEVLYPGVGEPATAPGGFGAGTIARAAACLAAPLVLYAYLPAASLRNPVMDWGNPETLRAVIGHVTAGQYRHLLFQYGWRGYVDGLGAAVVAFGSGCHVFLAFAVVGCVGLARERRSGLAALLAGSIAINVLFASAYDIVDIDPYFLPGILGVYVLGVVGIDRTFRWLKAGRGVAAGAGRGGSEGRMVRGTRSLADAAAVVTALALLGANLVVNLPKCNLARAWTAQDFGREVYRSLASEEGKPIALFVRGDEMCFIMLYLGEVEKMRPDVAVVADNYVLNPPSRPIVPGDFEVYYSSPTPDAVPGYRLVPWGLVYRVVPEAGGRIYEEFEGIRIRGITDVADGRGEPPRDQMTSNLAAIYYYQRGGYCLSKNDRVGALASFRRAADVNGRNPNTLYNLGLIYDDMGEWEAALEVYDRAINLREYATLAKISRNRMDFSNFMLSQYNPAYPEVRWTRYGIMLHKNAVLSEDVGLARSAVGAFQHAISINPDYFEAYFGLGDLYTTLDLYQEAYACFQKASQLDPNDRIVRQRLEDLYRAMSPRP